MTPISCPNCDGLLYHKIINTNGTRMLAVYDHDRSDREVSAGATCCYWMHA